MTMLFAPTLLLAQAVGSATGRPPVSLREISENWGGHQMISTQWIMIAAGLLLIVMAGMGLHRFWRTRDQRSAPLLVFHRLARRLGVGLRGQWLMYRIARQQALPTPITLMLCPATFRHHAGAYIATAGPQRGPALRRRADALATELFGPEAEPGA